MPASPSGYLAHDIGVVTGSFYDADGFLGVSIDAYGEQNGGVQPYENHQPHGYFSRPHDPDSDGEGNVGRGCTVQYATEGGQGHAWPCSDPRLLERLPQFAKGSSCNYGGPLLRQPGFSFFDGGSGSFTLSVPYGFDDEGKPSKSMLVALDVREGGSETLSVRHGDGMGVTMSAGSAVLRNNAGDVYVEVNDEGVVLNGSTQVNGGLACGAVEAALPAALSVPTVSALTAMTVYMDAVAAAMESVGDSTTGVLYSADGLLIKAAFIAIGAAATACSVAATLVLADIPAKNLSST